LSGDFGHKSFACPHKGLRQDEAISASGGNQGQRQGCNETPAAEAGPSHASDGGVDEPEPSQATDGEVAEAGPSHAMHGGVDEAGPSHAMHGGVDEAGPSHAMHGDVDEAGHAASLQPTSVWYSSLCTAFSRKAANLLSISTRHYTHSWTDMQADLQRKPVDFFSSGHHWLRVALLYMSVHE
jgi:hypothetical protein